MTGPRVDVNCCSNLHPEAAPCHEVTHVGNLEIGKFLSRLIGSRTLH